MLDDVVDHVTDLAVVDLEAHVREVDLGDLLRDQIPELLVERRQRHLPIRRRLLTQPLRTQ